MEELCTVQQGEVEPWQNYVDSSRVNQSIGKSYKESTRVKQSYSRVMQSQVVSSRAKQSLGSDKYIKVE